MEYHNKNEYPTINEKLDEIEEEYDVEIMMAADFGSNAWNLDSEESDKDVGFIFRQKPIEYVKIQGYKENISRHIEFNGKSHTFQGWNLKRFMEMAHESNPSAIEFLNSPITYRSPLTSKNFEAWKDLKQHVNKEFKPIGMFYHYRSMAKNNYRKYVQKRLVNDKLNESFPILEEREEEVIIDVSDAEDVFGRQSKLAVNHSAIQGNSDAWHRTTMDRSVKRHLYAVRALTYARYVAETHQVPPLDFPKFLDEEAQKLVEKDAVPKEVIRRLKVWTQMKKDGKGSEEVGNPLGDWIEEELSEHLDNPKHNVRGVEKKEVNETLEQVLTG
jgi:predicted nucleotidyltransferase